MQLIEGKFRHHQCCFRSEKQVRLTWKYEKKSAYNSEAAVAALGGQAPAYAPHNYRNTTYAQQGITLLDSK